MNSLWDDGEGGKYSNDPLAMRVYSSRLLGSEPKLVLHGGGNTSVKIRKSNIFGEEEELIYIKGSGWDLATIEAEGFAPVRLDVLKKMAEIQSLSDSDMVENQRAAMTDPAAPTPSVEAILHAIIPFKYVDHTHADAVVTLTNTPNGEETIRKLYGDQMLVVPYVMPGFILAKKIWEMTSDFDWEKCAGMILMSHGVFSFADDAGRSYRKMIDIVTQAEEHIEKEGAGSLSLTESSQENLKALSEIRKRVNGVRGAPVLALLNNDPGSTGFAVLDSVDSIAARGPLTPDHIIRTKQTPVMIDNDPERDIAEYSKNYEEYFDRNNPGELIPLDSAPRWAVWKGVGTIAFGRSLKEARIISDIVEHTISSIQVAEALGGWKALPEKDLFDIEYWELEQAKLAHSGKLGEFQGMIALVTGGAGGIGKATVEALHKRGAVVAALDINPDIEGIFSEDGIMGISADVTDESAVKESIDRVVRNFGGLDILISNAGTFPKSENISEINSDTWQKSLNLNLTSHQLLLKSCIPYLENGYLPSVIIVASKNVPAPGPGAAAYSAAKAGSTQLARVAALELGAAGIRVNVVHPNAVYDTAIWTKEVLEERAEYYGMSVEEYKTDNVLSTEVLSRDVAEMICAIAGTAFSKTTGAQIPIDGGNDRVI